MQVSFELQWMLLNACHVQGYSVDLEAETVIVEDV